jgi:hypothetical protein
MSQEATAQVIINLPLADAWDKLSDISLAHHYVPGIVKTEIVSEHTQGVGASRYVYRNAKSYIQETVEEWHEGHGFLIRLHKGDKPARPFRRAWFRYQLSEQGPNQTLFTASLKFELPWGAVGAWLEKKVVKFVAAILSDVTLSMKLYYESGEPTTPAALKTYKASLKKKR